MKRNAVANARLSVRAVLARILARMPDDELEAAWSEPRRRAAVLRLLRRLETQLHKEPCL